MTHFKKKKKRAGGEDGFLVVGPNGVTFLKDRKTIVATFPLSFLESYAADAGVGSIFVFTIKQKAVKKGDVLNYSFSTASEDIVRGFVGTIDRNLFGVASGTAPKTAVPKARPQRSSVGMPATKRTSQSNISASGDWDGRFVDAHNADEVFDMKERSGERFACLKSVVPLKKASLIGGREEKVPAVAVFSKNAISVLTFEGDRGVIEQFPWKTIRSFGAASADCFGYQIKNAAGEEVFVCLYTEQSGNVMDTLASRYAKANETIEVITERDRAVTRGVAVVGNTAQQGLIQSDIATFENVKVRRKKASSDAFQDGFLVIGLSAVSFLDKAKQLVSSHPLSFVHQYYVENGVELTYVITQKSVLRKGEKLRFTFFTETPERASFLLSSFDRYIFENKSQSVYVSGSSAGNRGSMGPPSPRLSSGNVVASASGGNVSPRVSPRLGQQRRSKVMGNDWLGVWDGQFREAGNAAADVTPTASIEGVRFVGQRAQLSQLVNALTDRSHVVAILNKTGVTLLQCKIQKGTVESHSWKSIKSFGISSPDTFGFQLAGDEDAATVAIITEGDGGAQMDALAQKLLESAGIDHTAGRERTETRGVTVMTDGWMTEKQRNEHIAADVAAFEHIAASRIRSTATGREDGFLVIGAHAITFLGKDKTVIASHPLTLIEAYAADLKNEKAFTYTLRKSKLDSQDDLLIFSFELHDSDRVAATMASIDRNIFFGKEEKAFIGTHESALASLSRLEGNRVVCTKTFLSDKKLEVISSVPKVRSVAVLSQRGIAFLSSDAKNAAHGVLEVYAWKDVQSFGATGEDCFGFKTKDRKGAEAFVCCYTGQSGHLMNLLAKKYSRTAEATGSSEPFPREYKP